MQLQSESLSPTTTKLTIGAEAEDLQPIKEQVVASLSKNVKVPGFRPGKAPSNLVEKQLDESLLQTKFLEQAINKLYVEAVQQQKLRPAAQPAVSVTKFVPYTYLEFTATVESVGKITMPDYKQLKVEKSPVMVTAKDVKAVLDSLRQRGADRLAVGRPAKTGDEVLIDFVGVDAKTKQPIAGADGKAYPLTLGSQQFIPGFEQALLGVKSAETKTFSLTFPKDYGLAALQHRQVEFTVTVTKVYEMKLPELDDTFAATMGPFKTVDDLKQAIKQQLTAERQQEADRAFDNALLEQVARQSQVEIPPSLIEEEIDRIEEEEKRSIIYRGQTWQEHLKEEGVTEAEHRAKQHPAAELRVKAGLVLAEIADREGVDVTPEELEVRLQLLKGQHADEAMRAELDKPENRRDIHSRLLTEKTLDKLRQYASGL